MPGSKGIRTFDPKQALDAYYPRSHEQRPLGRRQRARAAGKNIISWAMSVSLNRTGSTSQTLEYAYDDFCGYQLAKLTGNSFYQYVFGRSYVQL